jgi:hypothetical protein
MMVSKAAAVAPSNLSIIGAAFVAQNEEPLWWRNGATPEVMH